MRIIRRLLWGLLRRAGGTTPDQIYRRGIIEGKIKAIDEVIKMRSILRGGPVGFVQRQTEQEKITLRALREFIR